VNPGSRGLVVLAILAAALAGFASGTTAERAKWERWTYAHVAWETKGDAK
jgi:hypothetical protein